jgi:hypothetical protein
MHFQNPEVRQRSPCAGISAWGCGLVSDDGDRLSDVGVKLNVGTVRYYSLPFFVLKSVLFTFAGEAPGDRHMATLFCGFAVLGCILGVSLTECNSWRDRQDG